jgi:hypothetical protein
MMDVFGEALRSWQNFYFMAGGAASALIGLMFVALSLGMNLMSHVPGAEAKAFITPSVIYFVTVLVISCVMLIPLNGASTLSLLLGLIGLLGLGQTFQHIRLLIRAAKRNQDFTLFDWLTQVVLPVGMYASLLMVAGEFMATQWDTAFMILWVATVLLLVCAIANTWSLVVWIMDKRNG